ncbi:MAG: RagB/SusD family nutrient uptake outer membrane protein [Bacteroidota bacterium]
MKKNNIVVFGLACLSFTACNKIVETKETDAIVGDIALKTVANNQQGIIGAYAAMNTEMGILFNSVVADEVKVAEFYNSATVHEWQYTSTDITVRDNFTAFPLYYRIIDRVNRVLRALPAAVSSGAADDALKLRLKGEALFLRAFCHFEMYRYYSNSAVASDPALAYMEVPSLDPYGRITVGEYFTKLKADLADAKLLLPNNLTDKYRANLLSAAGLQARVSLYLKEWTAASTFASEYITGLPLSPIAQFGGIWTDANSNEVAFKLSRTPSLGGKIGSLYRGTSAITSGVLNIGTVTWKPSDKIWNSYDQTNDVRFAAYFKTEPLLTTPRSPRLINKYGGTAYATAGENVADAKVFRTGEMYLIRAEAKAELNDLAGAAADINALRAARINLYTNITYASKDAAITDIMNERFKELAYEGHRFFDLKRRNLPVERLASDAPNALSTTLPAGNFRFLLPIPNSEIQANPLIKQNTGYTN